jgi:hypothetical protein
MSPGLMLEDLNRKGPIHATRNRNDRHHRLSRQRRRRCERNAQLHRRLSRLPPRLSRHGSKLPGDGRQACRRRTHSSAPRLRSDLSDQRGLHDPRVGSSWHHLRRVRGDLRGLRGGVPQSRGAGDEGLRRCLRSMRAVLRHDGGVTSRALMPADGPGGRGGSGSAVSALHANSPLPARRRADLPPRPGRGEERNRCDATVHNATVTRGRSCSVPRPARRGEAAGAEGPGGRGALGQVFQLCTRTPLSRRADAPTSPRGRGEVKRGTNAPRLCAMSGRGRGEVKRGTNAPRLCTMSSRGRGEGKRAGRGEERFLSAPL